MHLPAPKDGTSAGSQLEKDNSQHRRLSVGAPGSPSSPGKKVLEKPQKVLPCPRCESMNTKFCYFNNYSVNQPRHFCRQCQRYWTVGGTLRNVPVGGGSRKKHRHQQGQHQRNEPYMRTGPGGAPGSSPLAMATAGAGQMGMPNMGYQQLMTHDQFNFSQLPGFVPHNSYGTFNPMDQSQGMYGTPLAAGKSAQQELFPSMHPMYGAMNPGQMQPVSGNSFYPDLGSLQGADQSVPGSVGPVKTEFWSHMVPQTQPQPQPLSLPQPPQLALPPPQQQHHHQQHQDQTQHQAGNAGGHQMQGLWHQQSKQEGGVDGSPCSGGVEGVEKTGNSASLQIKNGGYDSSMMLHLGLNSRSFLKSQWNQQPDSSGRGNGGSPPHGSSTIEEEGSTPTNGYSQEEGDTDSSMWQEMHDMQDIFQ